MRAASLVVSLLCLGGLAACGLPTVYRVDNDFYPMASYFRHYAGGKVLPVEVIGNPFGGDRQAFARNVADAVVVPPWYPPAAVEPVLGAPPPFRMVLAFGPAPGYSGSHACEGVRPAALVAPQAGQVAVQGAMCYRERALTEARGVAEAADLRRLIAQMSLEMLPAERRDDDDDDIDLVP